MPMRRGRPGKKDDAAHFLVQAMDYEEFLPQLLFQTRQQAAGLLAALRDGCQPFGLVHRQQFFINIERGEGHRLVSLRAAQGLGARDRDRWTSPPGLRAREGSEGNEAIATVIPLLTLGCALQAFHHRKDESGGEQAADDQDRPEGGQ